MPFWVYNQTGSTLWKHRKTSRRKADADINESFNPPRDIRAMEMEVIPPGTSVNTYEAYDILLEIKQMADLLMPLHEPRFANGAVIG